MGIPSLNEFEENTIINHEPVNENFEVCRLGINSNENAIIALGISIKPDGSIDFTNNQSYVAKTIINATNATPIVITCASHGRVTGDTIHIADVLGNTAANGSWTITKLSIDTFSLDGSVGNGAYTGGGTAYLIPKDPEDLANKIYVDNKISPEPINFGTTSGSNTLTADRVHSAYFDNNATIVLPTLSTSKPINVMIDFTIASGKTLTLPSGVKYPYGVTPTFTAEAGTINRLVFDTSDSGTTWMGYYSQLVTGA